MRQFQTTIFRTGLGIVASAAVFSAAAAGIPVSAGAASVPVQKIRPVTCRSQTFNVHYGVNREKCYAGAGEDIVRLANVHRITTGNNSGWFEVELHGMGYKIVRFEPRQTYRLLPAEHAELVAIDIT